MAESEDIVCLLRYWAEASFIMTDLQREMCIKAADEIMRLRASLPALCAKVKEQAAEIERLRAVLRPFLPAHTAYVQVVQNWRHTGNTLADRRASASECRSTAEEAAHEAFAEITVFDLHAVYEAIGDRSALPEERPALHNIDQPER